MFKNVLDAHKTLPIQLSGHLISEDLQHIHYPFLDSLKIRVCHVVDPPVGEHPQHLFIEFLPLNGLKFYILFYILFCFQGGSLDSRRWFFVQVSSFTAVPADMLSPADTGVKEFATDVARISIGIIVPMMFSGSFAMRGGVPHCACIVEDGPAAYSF